MRPKPSWAKRMRGKGQRAERDTRALEGVWQECSEECTVKSAVHLEVPRGLPGGRVQSGRH